MLKEGAASLSVGDNEQGQPLATWTPESFDSGRIEQLVGDLIPSEEVRNGRQFGVHIIDGQDVHSDIGRFVESTVFDEHFGNDLEKMRTEYGAYDASSTFLAVLDYDAKKPVGVLRIIRPSDAGLKSLNDLAAPTSPWYREGDSAEQRLTEIGNDPEHTVDIATMAVMPEYRSNHATDGASASLYSTCVRWSLNNGYNHWVTIVDKGIYNMMQSWGEPFQPFEGTTWGAYLDSEESLPVHTELHSGLERIKQFDTKMTAESGQKMDVHGLYTRGSGLDKQFVLPPLDDTVQ